VKRAHAFLAWLEDKSDWLSPIVVKEVRQVVRGREFNYSFGASLFVGLAVAFFGAADALTGNGTSGMWTFVALTVCLAVLGLAIVPLGAFSALRNERLERTLDLITLTALSPRRVIIGKLLAQCVKLLTLFAGIAPFIAMSFLLGGVDFVTILVWLAQIFMWSLWACAACLFLSTLFRSRAMSGLVFGGFGIVLLMLFGMTRSLLVVARFGGGPGLSVTAGADVWWALAIATSFCVASMVNLVLLAENRLTLPSENRVTRLRLGFLIQFLLIVGWTLSFIDSTPRERSNAAETLSVLGGLHLVVVALFTVSEDLVVPRRARAEMNRSGWRWLSPFLMPGGGRGAAYVLAQMGILLVAAWTLESDTTLMRWGLAMCGYICFFTGVPAVVMRLLAPQRSALHVRLAVLLLLLAATLLPDVVHYVFWQPEVLDLNFSGRHLVNPVRTLANWGVVETYGSFMVPAVTGLTGLVTYFVLIQVGARTTAEAASVHPPSAAAAAEGTGSANALY
jgi:hypothetical protein